MRQTGFDLKAGAYDLENYVALAEELTGVHLTANMLEDGTYSTGTVEIPTEHWTGVVIDVTDTHDTRTNIKLLNPAHDQH
jgi:hypothetical protein